MPFNSKNKIYILIAAFILACGLLFGYGFSIFQKATDSIALRIYEKAKEYKALEAEQRSYEAGKIDLAKLEKMEFKPSDLFSQDTRLVKEIKGLEAMADENNLELIVSISGTSLETKKVKESNSNIFLFPYSMSLSGKYSDLIKFMQEIEHAPFVTYVDNISISAIGENSVRAILNASFYIKK